MTIGPQTFSDFGGGVSDIFAGFGDETRRRAILPRRKLHAGRKAGRPKREVHRDIDRDQGSAAGPRNYHDAGRTRGRRCRRGIFGRRQRARSVAVQRIAGRAHACGARAAGPYHRGQAGYNEQATSYQATAATNAGNAANDAATFADITGAIKGVAAIASMFTGVGEVGGAAASAMGDATGFGGLY
jgi:hypothetical protein